MRHDQLRIGQCYTVKIRRQIRVVEVEWMERNCATGRILYYCRCMTTGIKLCFRSARRLRCPYDSRWDD